MQFISVNQCNKFANRLCDASCLSVVSFNSTKRRAQSALLYFTVYTLLLLDPRSTHGRATGITTLFFELR